MITPIVQEDEWLKGFHELPEWQPRGTSMLVVCPHPDDETLGAGGLIASMISNGLNVSLAAVTNGEAAYPEDVDLGRSRIIEHECALSELGIRHETVVRLNLPDSDVASNEAALTERIADLLSPTTLVLAPWPGDFHPDHESCGRAAVKAAQRVGSPLSFYVFWTWHRGTLEVLKEVSFKRFSLSKSAMLARDRALRCHHSQLHRAGGDPILPANLLAPMKRPFEVFIDA